MGSKEIESYYVEELAKQDPTPPQYALIFKTMDGWYYRYISQQEGEPFVFKHKWRPDMTISRDLITPQSVKEFIDGHPLFEIVDAKVIYHGEYPK